MNAVNRFAGVLGFALVSAQAQAVDFPLTSGALSSTVAGNTFTSIDTATGLTIQTSAWSSTANGRKFEAATLTVATDGMGVCNSAELNCTPGNLGSLGNNAASDLIVFRFSGLVSLNSLTLQALGDNDLSLWAGAGAFSPAGKSAGQLGGAAFYNNNPSDVNGISNVSLTAFTGTYDWLAVATSVKNIDPIDLVKLKSLTVAPATVAQPVPEPDTWTTMLAGLGLIGFAVSRRRQA